MVHFQAIDVVQHLLWGYMDPGHRLYDQGIRDYIAGNFYRKLDEAVARVLDMYGENNRNGSMTTFVVSDHGFQAHLRKAHLGNWLWQEGLSKLNEMRKARRTMAKTLALLASLDVLRLRRLLLTSRQRNSLGTTVTALREATDFQESKAFALGGNTYGLIFLTGAAGTRRETMEHITRRLSLFVDPETGKSPVRRIIRPCDTYGDAVSDELPDILIEPEDGYTFLGPPQPGEGLFSDVTLEHFHIGTHHKDGIIVANGEGIVNGAEPIRARIIDVLPTILYAMGLPVPAHVEGAVQSSIFTPDFSAGNPVEWLPAECGEVGNQTVYSEREQKMIEERLKALGYL
jgi:predicted AlkP superfamily phosphohydrolase/phosphomutase